jgi:hypothetical protein
VGICVSARVMTEVGLGAGVGVGSGVRVMAGSGNVVTVVGRDVVTVAAGVIVVLVAVTCDIDGRGVPAGDCPDAEPFPAPSRPADGIPAICVRDGNRRRPATRTRTNPAAKGSQAGNPAGPAADGPAVAADGSGIRAPQFVQNFGEVDSGTAAPHSGQNLRVMIVCGWLPQG